MEKEQNPKTEEKINNKSESTEISESNQEENTEKFIEIRSSDIITNNTGSVLKMEYYLIMNLQESHC